MTSGTAAELRGRVRHQEPMARHTTWRVGGPAQCFFEPADLDDLMLFLRRLPEHEPLLWLGLGSNLLVRDGGLRGTVIATHPALQKLELIEPDVIRAEAGVPCAKVARFAAQHHLTGAEFLAGIPGTLGGALAMNAGAFGGETWNIVARVETLSRDGLHQVRTPDAYQVAYRSVRGPAEEWFVAGHLRLTAGDGAASRQRSKQLLEKRDQTQPTQLPNAGSVFRNPPNDFAARLIESCGLKGVCIGGACVSEKHANFIINTGTATAADIEALIEKVAHTVEKTHGVRLLREVHIVGEAVAPGVLPPATLSPPWLA